MIITYQGIEFVKIQHGDLVLAFNPVSKDSSYKTPRFGADIALSSLNHEDMNGDDAVTLGEKKPFIIRGPGEYEVNELFVRGYTTISTYGDRERINTIYSVTVDNINVCFLGALGKVEMDADARKAIGDADVLIISIGGEGVLAASEAYQFAIKTEPKVIIPIHWGQVGDKGALKTFLKEGGVEDTKSVDKLTIKKKDIEGKQGEIIVLDALMS